LGRVYLGLVVRRLRRQGALTTQLLQPTTENEGEVTSSGVKSLSFFNYLYMSERGFFFFPLPLFPRISHRCSFFLNEEEYDMIGVVSVDRSGELFSAVSG